MELAFEEQHGRADACSRIAFSGMTDRAIVRAALEAIEVSSEADVIDAVLGVYLRILSRDLPSASRYRVLDGARELAELARSLGLAVGLGTGNVREGARMKLERGGLWDLFEFGGFGCDAEARDALLDVGRARGAERLGAEPHRCRTLVVGDTPRDIAAAHAIGARCLAVATGRFGAAELSEAGADEVVVSLASEAAKSAVERFVSEEA